MSTKDKPSGRDQLSDVARDRAAAPPAGSVAQGSARSRPAQAASSGDDVAAFVEKMRSAPAVAQGARGRLVFAMDATMSREPTWDMALALQGDMFRVVKDVGGLDVQLVYFRGMGECRASKWVSDPDALARLMTTVSCRGGLTQIGRVLSHTAAEARLRRVSALVFVGDAMEEAIDPVCGAAGELALLGVPAFLFQEGHDPAVTRAYTEIAKITRGATCRFDAGAADQLRELLTAVAVYAAGGRKALLALGSKPGGRGAKLLLPQLGPQG